VLSQLSEEMSMNIDVLAYLEPEFKWNMEGRAQVEVNEGINYLKAGTPNLSLAKFDAAIKIDKKLWIAFYYKGVCLKQLHRYAEALYAFGEADRVNPNNFHIYAELAKTHDLMKQYSNAEKYFELAAKVDPGSAIPVYLLGNHFLQKGQVNQAKKEYERALALDPMMLDAEVKLGFLASTKSKDAVDEPLKYIDDVLRKDSLHRTALVLRAVLIAQKDIKASLRNWNTLVRLSPGNTFFRTSRGVLFTLEERYDEAFSDLRKVVDAAQLDENTFKGIQSDYDKAIDLTYAGYYVMANVYGLPDDDAALVRKTYCLMFIRDYDEAYRAISAVTTAYESPLCIFLRAAISEHKGQHPKAFNLYNTALQYDNDILDAHKKRGIYYTELNRWDLAEKDFNEMLRINPESYYAYRLLGLCKYYTDRFDLALQDFNSYLDRDSLNKDVLGFRGMTYTQLKQVLPATADFLRSENSQSVASFDEIRHELDKLLNNNDTTSVVRWLDKFTAAKPSFLDAQKYLLDLLMKMNRWDDVSVHADRALLPSKETSGKTVAPRYNAAELSHLLSVKGTSLVYLEDVEGAILELNKAIDKNQRNSLAYLSRGKAYIRQKNRSAAIKDLRKAEEFGSEEAKNLLATLR
jgi:tetratricopeptide (TPR) repeat protein